VDEDTEVVGTRSTDVSPNSIEPASVKEVSSSDHISPETQLSDLSMEVIPPTGGIGIAREGGETSLMQGRGFFYQPQPCLQRNP